VLPQTRHRSAVSRKTRDGRGAKGGGV
jgi:hypothetical protein